MNDANSYCSQCGAAFHCGASESACWCQTRPVLAKLDKDATCLCPSCLDKAILEQACST